MQGEGDRESLEKTIARPRSFIEKTIKNVTVKIAETLVNLSWITPNRITVVSAAIGGPFAAWLIYSGYGAIAVAAIVLSGLLDDLDGDLARARGLSSPEGAILDSVLDRYVDVFLISALILLDPTRHLIPGLLALLGTTMVPYIRARTEAEGKSSIATIGDRTTRFILFVVGLLSGQILPLLIILAVISNLAAFHRLFFALKPEKSASV
ncbi:CDP-alcohol phosphatidyltransferase family protein [Oxynema sp. CENA135]|nr:CDP-alcohol phosphatidyltransferase family protein [Oxynema sp. CENA135]